MANANTIADLSVTPTNNTALLTQNATGSADSNTIDTIIQNLAGILARAYGDQGGLGTVGGSANAITLTSLSTYQQHQAGLQVAFKAGAANTGAATLNLDGLGTKKIRRRGDTALAAGDIAANGRYLLQYDAAYDSAAGAWVLMNPEIPANTYQPYDADLAAVADTGVSAFSGLLYGMTLANNASDATNDIDIAAGIAIDVTNAKFMKLASGLTKRLDASWAVGTNQGGLDTGSIANTTYHMWLIMRSDTGVVDVLFSASASSPTMPANYDYKRRVGSIVRSGGAIRAFVQDGDRFMWNVTSLPADISQNTTKTKALTTMTLPSGIRVRGLFRLAIAVTTGSSQNENVLIYDGANANIAAEGFFFRTATTDTIFYTEAEQFTNTSAQVYVEITGNPSSLNSTSVFTVGWVDTRGRLG